MMEIFNHEVYYGCAVTHASGYFYACITKVVD
jgi:hypothetical protein